ncbi:MAG: carbohydrate ABC transporter permease [Clostridia bacterium]|nr:carbohydrate ABC transporter permease [Clostridia bacterium]
MEKTFKVKKTNRNLNPFVIFLLVMLILYSAIFSFLIIFGTINSFKPYLQYDRELDYLGLPNYDNPLYTDPRMSKNPVYFPHAFYNYEKVIQKIPAPEGEPVVRYYAGFNLDDIMPKYKDNPNTSFFKIVGQSFFYAIVGAVIIAIVPAVVGYLAAKYPYKFSSLLYSITLFVIAVPLVGADPARVRFMSQLYLFDTMIGDFIVNFTFTNVYFLVFYAYYQGMSGTYAEAAEIDGASQLRTLVSIILPLAVKMMGTVILIFFINRWNSYNWQMIYLPNTWMIAYRIYSITSVNPQILNNSTPTVIAAAMILAIPILILFIIFKDKIMGNISMGGLKE